jgi:hypothetical protein
MSKMTCFFLIVVLTPHQIKKPQQWRRILQHSPCWILMDLDEWTAKIVKNMQVSITRKDCSGDSIL